MMRNMLVRYSFGIGLGAVTTFILFLLMQSLIKSDKSPFQDVIVGKIVDFVRVEDDISIETKQRKPEPPPPPVKEPPHMPKPRLESSDVKQGLEIGRVPVKINIGPDPGDYRSDGDYLPIVKVAPVYPRRAQTRGIEGYVLLKFTVTKIGTVRDPQVVESQPPGIFDRAALSAALKFKYKPKVVNGEPIDVADVHNRITFELQDE